MEIAGTILSKHNDQIRLLTSDRKQEIDIFYTEVNKYDIEELSVRQQVLLEVRIQSVDYYSLKLGKFWLREVLFPKKPSRKSSHRVKGSSDNLWASTRIANSSKEEEENGLV